MRMANGDPVYMFGITSMPVQILGRTYPIEVIAVDLLDDVLLGTDFIRRYKLVLDFNLDELRIKGLRIPLYNRKLEDETKPRTCRVIITHQMAIEASSRVLIDGKAVHPVAKGTHMVVPLTRPLGKQPILVAKTVVNGGNQHIPIEMLNPTEQDIMLYKDTNAALLTPPAC